MEVLALLGVGYEVVAGVYQEGEGDLEMAHQLAVGVLEEVQAATPVSGIHWVVIKDFLELITRIEGDRVLRAGAVLYTRHYNWGDYQFSARFDTRMLDQFMANMEPTMLLRWQGGYSDSVVGVVGWLIPEPRLLGFMDLVITTDKVRSAVRSVEDLDIDVVYGSPRRCTWIPLPIELPNPRGASLTGRGGIAANIIRAPDFWAGLVARFWSGDHSCRIHFTVSGYPTQLIEHGRLGFENYGFFQEVSPEVLVSFVRDFYRYLPMIKDKV